MIKIFTLVCILLACFDCFAQTDTAQTNTAQTDTAQKKLSVFLDCSGLDCDENYFRSEIKLVDFLLDREAADVHILITSQEASGGGDRYQIIFYGQNKYSAHVDTLEFTTLETATDDEKRKAQILYLQIGLSPLIAKTPFAKNISISMNAGMSALESKQQTTDKWNYWVFRAEVSGELNYEKVYKSNEFNGNFSANRTTNKLKLNFNVYGGFQRSVYEYEDTTGITKFAVKNYEFGVYHNLVKSLSSHISYGYQVRLNTKTFSNLKSHFYFNPAIEYNLYKYEDVNNRFFVIRYGVDVTNNHYYDTTLFDKKEETLYGQTFSAAVTFNQKWGTFNSGFYYHSFFRDLKLNRFSVEVNLEARITGALSVRVYTTGGLIHDQINLVKGDASAQDVLTRRRQLGSSFNLYSSFGVTYRFGSKLNNFVNPRFQGFGGF